MPILVRPPIPCVNTLIICFPFLMLMCEESSCPLAFVIASTFFLVFLHIPRFQSGSGMYVLGAVSAFLSRAAYIQVSPPNPSVCPLPPSLSVHTIQLH